MLSFHVFVATHPRRSLDSFSRPTSTPHHPYPKSHGITSFTDPHPLSSVVSYRFKNMAGRGILVLSLFITSLLHYLLASSSLSPLAATLMDLRASVANKRLTAWLSPLDATLTKNRGYPLQAKYLSLSFRIQTFGPSDQRMLQRVSESSPLFSSSYRLTYTTGAAQLFWNQSLVHTFHRDGGCTPSETRVLDWRWNIRPARNCQPQTVDCQRFKRGGRWGPVPGVHRSPR